MGSEMCIRDSGTTLSSLLDGAKTSADCLMLVGPSMPDVDKARFCSCPLKNALRVQDLGARLVGFSSKGYACVRQKIAMSTVAIMADITT